MCTRLRVTYRLFLSDFNKNWIFSTSIQKVLNPTKIHPVGAEFFHVEGRTDRQTDNTKQTVAYRNFSIAPTNGSHYGCPQKQHISSGHNYTAAGWGASIRYQRNSSAPQRSVAYLQHTQHPSYCCSLSLKLDADKLVELFNDVLTGFEEDVLGRNHQEAHDQLRH
jgi:hypothetical protein